MLFTDGARREINVKSHITSEELFQHMKAVSRFGELEQWNPQIRDWYMVNSAEDIKLEDGAKFRQMVRMFTVSRELGKQAQWHRMLN